MAVNEFIMNPDLYGHAMAENGDVLLTKYMEKLVSKINEELKQKRECIEEIERRIRTIPTRQERVHLDFEVTKKRIEELEREMENPQYILHRERTPVNHNSILHVAVQFGHVKNVKWVIQMCPDLVLVQNEKGETPLHMAAREGRADIVKELILGATQLDNGGDGKVKDMLKLATRDDKDTADKDTALHIADKDTALHMAARNCHLKGNYFEVVKLLLLKQEGEAPLYWDRHSQHLRNIFEETPLYLAVERGKKGQEVVLELLKTCNSQHHYSGPGGRTALHAAAFHYKDSQDRSIVEKLLEKMKDQINFQEKVSGWAPLQYAACSGNVLVMEMLLKLNPDCWEMVDKNGQNILHIAVDMNMEAVIDYIVGQHWCRHLINKKNKGGDTPLHLLVASDYKVYKLWNHDKADKQVFNGANMTPVDLVWSSFKKTAYDIEDDAFWGSETDGGRIIAFQEHDNLAKFKRFKEESRKKLAARIEARKTSMTVYNSLVIVAALIATISSAAAFVIPGGYETTQGRDEGMAVLAKKAAFKVFIITNTIALASSVTSILLCLNALYYYSINKGERDITLRYTAAGVLILVAIFCLMFAFIAAAFAVLAHSTLLVMSTGIIVCIVFIVSFLGTFLCQLLRPKDKDTALAVQGATNNGNRAMDLVQGDTSNGKGAMHLVQGATSNGNRAMDLVQGDTSNGKGAMHLVQGATSNGSGADNMV